MDVFVGGPTCFAEMCPPEADFMSTDQDCGRRFGGLNEAGCCSSCGLCTDAMLSFIDFLQGNAENSPFSFQSMHAYLQETNLQNSSLALEYFFAKYLGYCTEGTYCLNCCESFLLVYALERDKDHLLSYVRCSLMSSKDDNVDVRDNDSDISEVDHEQYENSDDDAEDDFDPFEDDS